MSPGRDPLADEAAAWLLRLREQPGDAARRKEFDAWIARSDRHAEAWRAARLMWRTAGTLGPAQPVPANGNKAFRRWGAAAAALAACLAIVVLPTLQLYWRADYLTATGTTRMLDLADGSRVHLDSASALAVDFSDSRRGTSLLSGQAFFEVATNRDRPFVVRAGEVEVMVTGTAFDVRLEPAEIVVEVQSGSVRVDYPDQRGTAEALLSPGQRLTVARNASGAKMTGVAASQVASWRRGRLLIEGATVEQLVEEIRRYRSGLIVLTDDALARRQVTGVFDLRDPVRALRTVVEPHAGRVREIMPWLVVVSGS